MKLRLTAYLDGRNTDINLTAEGRTTVADVARVVALGQEAQGDLPTGKQATLRVHYDGEDANQAQLLPPHLTLREAGLRSGAYVRLGTVVDTGMRQTQALSHPVTVKMLTGRQVGKEFALDYGKHLLGRAKNAQVPLEDSQASHEHCQIVVGDQVEVVDNGSSNGLWVNEKKVTQATLSSGDVLRIGKTHLEVQLDGHGRAVIGDTGDLSHMCPPVVVERPVEELIEAPEIPTRTEVPPLSWLAVIAPLVTGLVLAIATGRWLYLLFVLMSPIMMVVSNWDRKRKAAKADEQARADYLQRIERAMETVQQRHEAERVAKNLIHRPVAEMVQAVHDQDQVLWSRRWEHPEFLQVRCGIATLPASYRLVDVRTKPNSFPDLVEHSAESVEYSEKLHNAPCVLDFLVAGSIGLCGRNQMAANMARSMVAHLAAMHSPAHLSIAVLTGSQALAQWRWAGWLPHTRSAHSPLSGSQVCAQLRQSHHLLDELEQIMAQRSGDQVRHAPRGPIEKESSELSLTPAIVVVVDQPAADVARIARVAEMGPDAGIHVLWVAETVSQLPGACRSFVDATDDRDVRVGQVRHETKTLLHPEELAASEAEKMARVMAAYADGAVPVADETDVPRAVSLLESLAEDAQTAAESATVMQQWGFTESGAGLRDRDRTQLGGGLWAPVGHTGQERLELDIRSQGPHAMVGGTTGSGKSEFLQAWVLGMAFRYSPRRVNFLFVDYKGGAAFADCVKLPHCVGMVTDLNDHLVHRALRSLRAELTRREHLLNELEAKNVMELEKAGHENMLPSLLIVVDEFAALVGDVPEFVDGVVDIAQRGRSLGLHLILATQRPSGVISPNLRANTNLRVALRMADGPDSAEVVGDPVAASFSPTIPGRGVAKVGPGGLVTFQSAYPSGKTTAEGTTTDIAVQDADFDKELQWAKPAPTQDTTDVNTDIQRVVAATDMAAKQLKLPAAHCPFLPELQEHYDVLTAGQSPAKQGTSGEPGAWLPVAMCDAPDTQSQHWQWVNLEEGHVVLVGASGSGKTAAVASLALSAGLRAADPGLTDDDAGGDWHVYVMDMTSNGHSVYADLRWVGAVIDGSDLERAGRLLRWLEQQCTIRGEAFAGFGGSTLTDHWDRAQGHDYPRVVLFIDGFGTLRDVAEKTPAWAKVMARLETVLTLGRAVGIHVVLTTTRMNECRPNVLSAVPQRIILRQSDADQYSYCGVPKNVLQMDSAPGRAMDTRTQLELQLAAVGTSADVAAQACTASERYELLAAQAEPDIAPRLAVFRPDTLPVVIKAEHLGAPAGQPVVGMSSETLEMLPFDKGAPVVVVGSPGAGRSNAVAWLVSQLVKEPNTQAIRIGTEPVGDDNRALYAAVVSGEADVQQYADQFRALATALADPKNPAMVLVLEDVPGLAALSSRITGPVDALVKAAVMHGHTVILDGPGTRWSGSGEAIRAAKTTKQMLLLQLSAQEMGNHTALRLKDLSSFDQVPGRGYWVSKGRADVVQVPLVTS